MASFLSSYFFTLKPWSHAYFGLWFLKENAGLGAHWVKNLKAITIPSQKCISMYFGVTGFQPSHLNAHCSLTMWPWWNGSGRFMVGLCPHMVNRVRVGEGGGLARHNPAVRLIWGEPRKMEGAKLALICPSPAQGPESRGYELLIYGCLPTDPWWRWKNGLRAIGYVREMSNLDVGVIKFDSINIEEGIWDPACGNQPTSKSLTFPRHLSHTDG